MTAFSQTVNEYIGVSDIVTGVDAKFVASESGVIGEVVSPVLAHIRTVTDTMAMTDSVAAVDAKFLPGESPGPTEVVTPSLAILRTFTETMAAGDSASETKVTGAPTFTQTPTEFMGILDIGQTTDTVDVYTEPVGITDFVVTSSTTTLTFTDPMNVGDNFSTQANLTLTFTEMVGPIDNQRITFNGSVFRTSTDIIGISEQVITTLTSTVVPVNYSLTFTDTMGIEERPQYLVNSNPLTFSSNTYVLVNGLWKQSSWALRNSGIWVYPPVWLFKDGAWIQIQ